MILETRFLLRAVILCFILFVLFPIDAAAQQNKRRGEIGLQIGVRKTGDEIVPEDSNGLGFVYGVEGAWAFNQKWAIFGDLNFSTHDSRLFCRETEYCSAYTPESKHKLLSAGVERRFKRGPKGGQWVLGLATGLMDLEWRGIQVHHGVVSLSFGRRANFGPGVLRWCVRVETGFQRTDRSRVAGCSRQGQHHQRGVPGRLGNGVRRQVLKRPG